MSAPIGPKDYFSKLPEDLKITIGQLSPELLSVGQKTSKTIQKLLERNDIWINIAKKLDVSLKDTTDAKRQLTKEIYYLNKLFEQYFPNANIQAKDNPFARNLEFHEYISKHIHDISFEGFSKLMNEFSKGRVAGSVALNALKAFIREGVLNSPDIPWEKYLMQALGQKYHRANRESHMGDPKDPPEVFTLLLQAYVRSKPKVEDKEKLFQELWNIIYIQRNFASMVSLFNFGEKVNTGQLFDFTKFWVYNLDDVLNLELSLRFLAEKFENETGLNELLGKLEKENSATQQNAYHKTQFEKAFKLYREILDGKPILRHLGNEDFKRDLLICLKPSDPRLPILIKYLTSEEKLQLLQLLDESEKQEDASIAKLDAADPSSVAKQQTASHMRYAQIRAMLT